MNDNNAIHWLTENAPYYVLEHVANLDRDYYDLIFRIDKLIDMIEDILDLDEVENLDE